MKADFHVHSSFSADSNSPLSEMVERGISSGLDTICFTEHMDFDLCTEGILFEADTAAYQKEFEYCKQKYASQIELLFGIELGLQPHLAERLQDYLAQWPFDFIIGSSHLVDGMDPYYPTCFEHQTEADIYRKYFLTISENLETFSNIDVYGHLDYVVRYGPHKNKYYSYEKYQSELDKALHSIIHHGLGIELNTSGYRHGLGFPNPHPDILKKYREMGGEIITVGCDAHHPAHLAHSFPQANELLKECGFRYYTIFRNRTPAFIKL